MEDSKVSSYGNPYLLFLWYYLLKLGGFFGKHEIIDMLCFPISCCASHLKRFYIVRGDAPQKVFIFDRKVSTFF